MDDTQERTRALVEAGIALSSELSLDAVLEKVVETAQRLTGARYAALGVLDPTASFLERFITVGVDEETRREIGDLPTGRGILGVLIREPVPLRLHDLSQDPRSVGFPPGHPPMRTFLGVPIALRGVAYGRIYLTEKEGGADFAEEDEDAVTLLASQAAVAIENARLYESSTRWAQQLESLNEVMNVLVTEFDLGTLLQLVAERLRELLDASAVSIALPHGDGLRIAASAADEPDPYADISLGPHSKTARVLARKRSERVDAVLDDPEVDQELARRLGMRTALYVPLVSRDKAIGVIGAHDKRGRDPRFTHEDLRIAEIFAARAAVAVELRQHVARDALQRVVTAQEVERRRLARELHDETGQALTSILLGLRGIEEAAGPEAKDAVEQVRELVRSTLQDVRQLAVDLRPKALDDFGLVAALERLAMSLADQTGLEIEFVAGLASEERLPFEIETALYRIVQESLTNVVKHARASRVSVVLNRKEDSISVVVEDDGIGFEPARAREDGIGLLGMRERVGLLGGEVRVESRPGAGTTFVAEVPL